MRGLCAVVKADGYGHGAVPAARAALAGGAAWLAVATADEAAELRAAGIEAPVLVMGALSDEELPVALAARRRGGRLERAVRRGAGVRARGGAGAGARAREARHRDGPAGTRDARRGDARSPSAVAAPRPASSWPAR